MSGALGERERRIEPLEDARVLLARVGVREVGDLPPLDTSQFQPPLPASGQKRLF